MTEAASENASGSVYSGAGLEIEMKTLGSRPVVGGVEDSRETPREERHFNSS